VVTVAANDSRLGLRWTSVCIDCPDADELAAFYGRLLGWEIILRDDGWVALRDPDGGRGLLFQSESWYHPPVWPEEPGEQTKMLHLEIQADDVAAAVAHAVAAGATVAAHQPDDRSPDELVVMVDPAGHPFCLFRD
jgi:catechol 2,3-dioxygenase-like lactoylglutathione lyase family enzyme